MRQRLRAIIPTPAMMWLESHQDAQSILTNIFWLTADNALYAVFSLIVGGLVARHLGPAQQGILTFAVGYVAVFAAIANLGLDHITVRALVRQDDPASHILGTGFGMTLAMALIMFPLATGIAWLTEMTLDARLAIVLISGYIVTRPIYFFESWFKANVIEKYLVWSRNFGLVIVNILKIGFILAGWKVAAFAFANLLWHIVVAGATLVFFTRVGPSLASLRFQRKLMTDLLVSAWPLMISGVALAVYRHIDKVMLGMILPPAEVGFFWGGCHNC